MRIYICIHLQTTIKSSFGSCFNASTSIVNASPSRQHLVHISREPSIEAYVTSATIDTLVLMCVSFGGACFSSRTEQRGATSAYATDLVFDGAGDTGKVGMSPFGNPGKPASYTP